MERPYHIEAQREQLIDNPFSDVKRTVNRVGSGADAADKQPFEQNQAGRQDEHETCAGNRQCRQIQQRLRIQIDVSQNRNTRQKCAEMEHRDDEKQHRIERGRRNAAPGPAHRPSSVHNLRASHAVRGRAPPGLVT